MTVAVPSIVASLRFAAALLHLQATPQQICTKESLGAIVLDSHRLAQQSSALKVTGTEPRQILKTMISLESSLDRLAFGDISWDFEGRVAETLEMELQDVEERAATTLERSVCVLLTACGDANPSTPTDTAVLWFPYDANNNGGKKYLLYVVPGRVKVVKSVPELIKKMFEEIPALRMKNATYRVWTLMAASATCKGETKGSKTRLARQPEAPEDDDPPISNSPAIAATTDQGQKASTPILAQQQQQLETRPPIRIRALKKDLVEAESMFSFSRTPFDEAPQARSSTTVEMKLDNRVEVECGQHTVAESAFVQASGDIVPCSPEHLKDNQPVKEMPSAPKRSQALAASYSGHLKDPVVFDPSPALWRSLDSDIKRLPRDRGGVFPSHAGGTAVMREDQDDTPEQHTQKSVERHQLSLPTHAARLKMRFQPVPRTKVESMFQFSASECIRAPKSPISPAGHELDEHTVYQEHEAFITEDNAMIVASSKELHPSFLKQDEGSVEEDEQVPRKKRSARDHYRSKLGARVWWELEYQTNKILQQDCQKPCLLTTPSAVRTDSLGLKHVTRAKEDESLRGRATASLGTSSKALVPPIVKEEMKQPVALVEVAPPQTSFYRIECATPDPIPATRQEPKHQYCGYILGRPSSPVLHNRLMHETRSTSDTSKDGSHDLQTSLTASRSFDSRTQREAQSAMRSCSPSRNVQNATWIVEKDNRNPTSRPKAVDSRPDTRGLAPPPSSHEAALKAMQSSEKATFQQGRRQAQEEEQDSVLMATMVAPRRADFEVTKPTECHSSPLEGPRTAASTEEDRVRILPFSGRVPIRAPQPAAKVRTSPQKAWHAESDSGESEGEIDPKPAPRAPETQSRPGRAPPPVATFITVELGGKEQRDNNAMVDARQHKLAELRQKKLQQLQKAREDALGHKKKPHATATLPIPVVVAPPSKNPVVADTAGPEDDLTAETSHLTLANPRVRKPSNRKLIQNAIEYTLLAGGPLEKDRVAALQAMAESSCDNFVVLLKSAKELKFRALYEHHVDRNRVVRLFSVASSAPPVLSADVISQFFRYNSGKKEFTPVDARDFTVKTDACALVDQLVFKKKTLSRLL